jgi:hypothetical protein
MITPSNAHPHHGVGASIETPWVSASQSRIQVSPTRQHDRHVGVSANPASAWSRSVAGLGDDERGRRWSSAPSSSATQARSPSTTHFPVQTRGFASAVASSARCRPTNSANNPSLSIETLGSSAASASVRSRVAACVRLSGVRPTWVSPDTRCRGRMTPCLVHEQVLSTFSTGTGTHLDAMQAPRSVTLDVVSTSTAALAPSTQAVKRPTLGRRIGTVALSSAATVSFPARRQFSERVG